jgi:hypothetical protein
MKLMPLTILLLLTLNIFAQKTVRYYSFEWKECAIKN